MSMLPLAHGVGSITDPPIPQWLAYYGAAAVLVLSFAALGALWRTPLLERERFKPLFRVPRMPLRVLLGGLGLLLFFVVFMAALVGERSVGTNLAPTFVFVIFWIGLVPVSVLFGNVWAWLNPWRAAADIVAWVWERARLTWDPPFRYPERLGRWPAAFLLLAFTALELAYTDPGDPRILALAIAIYSWVTWVGIAAFGRDVWLPKGEAFTVYFGLLARIAPLGTVDDGPIVVRWPFTGLAGATRIPGTIGFIAVMLGSVGFDGLSRSSFWQDLAADVEGPFVLDQPGIAELVLTALNLGGLTLCVLAVGLAYVAAVAVARSTVDAQANLVRQFALSLVPIALVYAVAHYFSLLVIQGQFLLPLAADPFGFGWDLFGALGDYEPDLAPMSPNTVWYVQVGALVAGHVAGLAVAHDRAVALFRSREAALRSQYAMLALMVVYTVGGLWLLSQG